MRDSTTRRDLLKASGAVPFLPLVTQQEEKDARDIWETLIDSWEYEDVGLKEYHGTTGDYGSERDILIIDRGFSTERETILNRLYEGNQWEPFHLNVRNTAPPGEKIEETDLLGHGTKVTSMAWKAAPNANYHIARIVKPDQEGSTEEEILPPYFGLMYKLEHAARNSEKYDVVITSQDATVTDYRAGLINHYASGIPGENTLFIVAAGNSGNSRPYPPATVEDALTVVGSTKSDTLSETASPQSPAEGKPNIAAPGEEVLTLSKKEGEQVYETASSFAAPCLAGIALLLLEHGTAPEVRDAILETASDIDIPEKRSEFDDIEGQISVMDAYNSLTDDSQAGSGGTSELDPSVEWACNRVAVNADQYNRVNLIMNDGTQEVFTEDYSGRTIFAYEGYRGEDRTTDDNPADEIYSDYHGTIQEVTASNGDHTITFSNDLERCPDTIQIDCSEATVVGDSIGLTGFRIEFVDGSYKEYGAGDFGSTITLGSPSRVIDSVYAQEYFTENGDPYWHWTEIPNPNTECDPGSPATTFDCIEVTVTPEEPQLDGLLASVSVTLEFTDGSTQEVETRSEIEFPATFSGSGQHGGKVIEAVEIYKMSLDSTHYLVNPDVESCQPETQPTEEEEHSSEGLISVITGDASPNEDTPQFVTFNGRVENVPEDTTVTVGFDLKGDDGIWAERWTNEITPDGATEFSTTEKMSYIDGFFQYRAFVKTDGESSKQTGETRSVRVPNFIDTVEVETVDVNVSGTSATVTGRITDFGKATSVTGGIDLSQVEDQGILSFSTSSQFPELSPDGQREFDIEISELAPNIEYEVRAKAMLPGVVERISTQGNALQFQTGSAESSANFRPEITEATSPVEPGETLEVTAAIENTGNGEGTQEIILQITHNPREADAETETVDTVNLTLGPGETETVTFNYVIPDVDSDHSAPIYVETEDMGTSSEVAVNVPGPEPVTEEPTEASAQTAESSTQTPTETSTPTEAPTETPTETETPTPTETPTDTPTPTETETETPTDTPSPTPTETATETPEPEIESPGESSSSNETQE
ncbi:S8/S53 family peptidase [Halomicrobium salinisoli]|uniref:S8/S53 family peptidase n=1 Tax=Halomicrobium salinisoli TaxID=2878391 RepID=UPI001CF026D9|nr:S8/S53 family peptidase [Halomicrobium salinisoli]